MRARRHPPSRPPAPSSRSPSAESSAPESAPRCPSLPRAPPVGARRGRARGFARRPPVDVSPESEKTPHSLGRSPASSRASNTGRICASDGSPAPRARPPRRCHRRDPAMYASSPRVTRANTRRPLSPPPRDPPRAPRRSSRRPPRASRARRRRASMNDACVHA